MLSFDCLSRVARRIFRTPAVLLLGVLLSAASGWAQLTFTKSFNPNSIPLNGTTTLTLNVEGAFGALAGGSGPPPTYTGVAFTDNLPGGITISSTPGLTQSGCNGTITATAGTTSISLSGDTLTQSDSACTISVNVVGTQPGTWNNSVTATDDQGDSSTAMASLTVSLSPPSITKAFAAMTIPLGSQTALSFQITNPNPDAALTGVSFTDSLPGGLSAAGLNGNSCGGSVSASGDTVSLSGGGIGAGGSCTLAVNVTGVSAGGWTNSVTVSDTAAGTGNTSMASIGVVAPPSISKAFSPTSIPLTGTTTLTFTITNPAANTVPEAGVAFSDTLPSGLLVATPNGLMNFCGGTATATPAGTDISLTGGSVTTSCTVVVNVISVVVAGTITNTSQAVSSTNGGTGNTATAMLTVVAPPSISKAFSPTSIPLNGTSMLTFTITNPVANTVAEMGVRFNDMLPPGLTVVDGSSSACGGTVTTTSPGTITLTGATIAANSQCQFSVTVTGASAGTWTNTTAAVSSTNGSVGNTATASLTVVAPPSITKSFGAMTIPLGGSTSLTFQITNNPNNTVAVTGVAFTDTLPSGVSGVTSSTTGCGGSVTVTATQVMLSGGSIATSGSCNFSVTVTGTAAGTWPNSVTVTSSNGGTNPTAGTASLIVVAPPSITKQFGAMTIPLGGSTSLTFQITNNPNNTVAVTGVAFTDMLPAGVSGVTSSTTGCGGSVSVTATQVMLSGGSIAASASCNFSVTVTGTAAGTWPNSVTVTSSNGGTNPTAGTASLIVVAPPSITKSFGAMTIPLGGSTSLTFTISNDPSNTVAVTGVAFTDTLPSELSASGPITNTCNGSVTTPPGSAVLTGGSIAVSGSCTIVVTVTGNSPGVANNTVTVTSGNGGTNPTAGTATLVVIAPPEITKSFSPNKFVPGGTTTVSFLITNPNSFAALTGVAFSDTLPGGMTVANPNGLTASCNGTVTANPGSSAVSLTGGSISDSGSCSVSVTVTAPEGIYNNMVQVTSTNGGTGNTSMASVDVATPPVLSKVFGAVSIPPMQATGLTFTLTNPNNIVTLDDLTFTDTLPTGLEIASPSGLTGACGGGTITAPANGSTIALSGASLAPGASCTFGVTVINDSPVSGYLTNTTSTVTSIEALPGVAASARLFIGDPFLVNYAANLNSGESYIDIVNAGSSGASPMGPAFGLPAGNICANIYALDASEELLSCCSCLVTPDQTVNVGVNADLLTTTLTGQMPTSITAIVISTLAGGDGSGTTCSNSAALTVAANLADGTAAFRTTLHATATGIYATTEAPFAAPALSASELASLASRCANIIGNGSGSGICAACAPGAQGAAKFQ